MYAFSPINTSFISLIHRPQQKYKRVEEKSFLYLPTWVIPNHRWIAFNRSSRSMAFKKYILYLIKEVYFYLLLRVFIINGHEFYQIVFWVYWDDHIFFHLFVYLQMWQITIFIFYSCYCCFSGIFSVFKNIFHLFISLRTVFLFLIFTHCPLHSSVMPSYYNF